MKVRQPRLEDIEVLFDIANEIANRVSGDETSTLEALKFYASGRHTSHTHLARVVENNRGDVIGFFSGCLMWRDEIVSLNARNAFWDVGSLNSISDLDLACANRGDTTGVLPSGRVDLLMSHCFWRDGGAFDMIDFAICAVRELEQWFRGNRIGGFHFTMLDSWESNPLSKQLFASLDKPVTRRVIERGFSHFEVVKCPRLFPVGYQLLRDRSRRYELINRIFPLVPDSRILLTSRLIASGNTSIEDRTELAIKSGLLNWRDRGRNERRLQDRFKELETWRATMASTLGVSDPRLVTKTSKQMQLPSAKRKKLLQSIVSDLQQYPEFMCLR